MDSKKIDSVKFGNQPEDYVRKIEKDKYGTLEKSKDSGMIDEFIKKFPPPKNSSDTTKKELEHLKKISDNVTEKEKSMCFYMEHHHLDFFVKTAEKLGIKGVDRKKVNSWADEAFPIVYYLKDHFNRPRPNELAGEYGIKLHPITRTDANSAAYPSGHTMDFLVMIYQLMKLKPSSRKYFVDLYNKIKDVRELSGVHYPSDGDGSEELFKLMLKYKII
jgi:hypothetical protein